MKKYIVSVPIRATAHYEVIAYSESEALSLAQQRCGCGELDLDTEIDFSDAAVVEIEGDFK